MEINEVTADDVIARTDKLIDEVIHEMRINGLTSSNEPKLCNALWRLVNEHTKLLRQFYKVGE